MKKQPKTKNKPGLLSEFQKMKLKYLQPSQVGPWIVGTNKTAQGALETAVSRVVSACLNGWCESDLYLNAGMRRGEALMKEALASLDVFGGYHMATDLIYHDPELAHCAAFPHGWDPVQQVGATITVPTGPTYCRRDSCDLDTALRYEALTSLAMVPNAIGWIVVAYSPPFLPMFWRFNRNDHHREIDEIRIGLKSFGRIVNHRLEEIRARDLSGSRWRVVPATIES